MIRKTTHATAGMLAGALLLAGCSMPSSTVTTTANNTAAGNAPAAKSKPAGIGDSITIGGLNSEKLTVTLVKVFPDAKGADAYNQPDAGKQFYGVQLRVTNDASAAWTDSPSNCVTLKDASGQEFEADVSSVAEGQGFPGSSTLAHGDSALGVIAFQVPKGDKVTELQFTTDSGMGPGTAQWNL